MKYQKLYLDLDGVLANFDKGFHAIAKRSPVGFEDKHGTDAFWKTVYENPTFFQDLEPYPYLMNLIDLCAGHSVEPLCILSAPSKVNTPLCMIQKRLWVDKHLSPKFPAIFTKDKYKYAAPNTLLIDDHQRNLTKWEAEGGVPYLFETHEQSVMTDLHNFLKNG
ncbi:MAG: hypothetical protein KAQ85_02310 [Thermodesulfovibrionia bacterium]|nr:hypothetical protein [Thermodesulfovibrionia bacterium]